MADAPARPPSPPGGSQDDDVVERRTLRDYYIILRERLWIALPLALLISVGYSYKKMQVSPSYYAVATMQLEKPDTIVNIQGVVDQGVHSDIDLNTIIEVLNSAMLRTKVNESFNSKEQEILQRAALKHSPPGTAPSSIGLPLGTVTPISARNSLMLRIGVTHDDPEAAALVANRYVDQFMDYLFNNAGGRNEAAITYLVQQEERLRQESDDKEKALQAYLKEKNLLSLDGSKDLVTSALMKAGALRGDAQLQLLNIEDKIKTIELYKTDGRNLLEVPEIAVNPTVAGLKSELLKLQSDQNLLSERYLERHPDMVLLANRIAVTEEGLKRAIDATIADLRAKLTDARQTLQTYQDEFSKRERESLRLGDLSIEFGAKKRESEVAKSNHLEILKRLNDLRTRKNVEKAPVRPLDRALPRSTPTAPNKGDITRTGVGIFALVFLGVAIGLSFVDDRIKSAWDVESFIGVNLLGIIPDLASIKDDEKYTMLLDTNKQSPGIEAFLSAYSSIKIHSKLDFPKSILVTSTIPGEGKTLISCNVAGSFARHGKKTLLLDCDLRRPMLHRHFKQQNTAGLLPWFENGAIVEGTLADNPWLGITKVAENLSLLSSGGRSKSPTELLENPLFGQLLERLKKEYDLIIVDSPPLGAVTDSLLIAERTDEVVYVCRFNRAYRKHIRLFMRTLRNGKNEVLGIVLNGLSPRRIEYYSNYRYYRSYKKYYGAQT